MTFTFEISVIVKLCFLLFKFNDFSVFPSENQDNEVWKIYVNFTLRRILKTNGVLH